MEVRVSATCSRTSSAISLDMLRWGGGDTSSGGSPESSNDHSDNNAADSSSVLPTAPRIDRVPVAQIDEAMTLAANILRTSTSLSL